MINFPPIIERIKKLLEEGTEQTATYAALEARLAIERVVYDRLRQRHDYISHEQLKKWQPGGIINQLISDVDPHVTQTRTLRMAKQPGRGVKPDDDDFVDLGTEVGFDSKSIVKMWNALGRLALHVRVPRSKDDEVPQYGDREKISAKVQEVLAELERLSKATMAFSGLGDTVSFECVCGAANKRRAMLLQHNQQVFCINPECKASWRVLKKGEEFIFEGETCDFACQGCGNVTHLPWRFFFEMKFNQRATFVCASCDQRNYVEWRLTQVAPASIEPEAAAPILP